MIQDVRADFALLLQIVDADGAPVDPDDLPTFRVLDGTAGVVGSGTAEQFQSGVVTGVTNANPAVVTSASHGLVSGTVVTVAGVGGATGANGTRVATVLSGSTFSVPVAAGGSYTSGGSWKATGLVKLPFDTSLRSVLEPGRAYTVLVDYEEGGDPRTRQLDFVAA